MPDKSLFHKYVEKMESIKDPYFKNVNEDLLHGQNSYLRMRMKGSSFFNDEWVKKIEDCIYELGQIINNPLEVTKAEGAITPIELAKKINYESIQHLASHSQYIKDIDEEGNVIPSKILAQFHKEELHTYENRFIATFIRRLVLFVEKRYEFIRSTVNFDTKDVMYIKNRSIVDGQEVTIETKVTLKKPNEDAQSKIGREYVKRVEEMRRYVNYFYNSPFMKELKTEKNVRKPILQTNIIRKNPYYHKCYETFLFIEKFSQLGVEYALDEKFQDFNEKERQALNYILASNLLSLEATESSGVYKKSTKTYKPRLLTSCDDEIFTYGNLVKGPIEFVRVDEKYKEYLNDQLSTKIPAKPNKVEREYFKEEIELKKNTKKHHNEVDSLLRRVKREIAKWEKYVLKLIEERNIQEAKEAEAQLEALRKEEHNLLEKKRREIIAAAQAEKAEIKAERLAEAQKAAEEARLAEEASKKAIQEALAKALEEVKAQEEAKVAEEAKVEEEQVEEPAIEEAVPEEQPVEEPVQEEEKVEEVAPVEEKAPVEEVQPEIEPQPEPEPEPVVEEPQPEPVEEPVQEVQPEPVVEEQPKEEPKAEEAAPVVDEPQPEEKVEEVKEEKKPAPKKAPAKKKTPAKKKAPAKKKLEKPQPVVEEAKPEPVAEEVKPEPVAEEVKPEPVVEEAKPEVKEEKAPEKPVEKQKSAEKTGENKKPKAPAKKAPAKKPAQKKAPKKESKPVQKAEPQPTILAKIPGRFIVKSNKGYVVSKSEFSNNKSQARVFDDFNEARRYKTLFGGKVIKL